MDRNAALARLGLTGAEDSAAVTRAYGERLSVAQERLVAAQTDAEREQHQTALSGLVEAYQLLTVPGVRGTAVNDSSATMMRSPAQAAHDTYVRMETGAVLADRLEVGELLGQGGMGDVYAARDRLRDQDVAIKVLRQDLVFSTMAKERFLAEAKVSCNLSHPNIVRVYDVGMSGNNYYLSMERLKGETLRQRITQYNQEHRDFTVAEVTEIARQLVDALRYAHRYIVHRDIKPENIWLSEDGTVKLMDFGIARAYSNSQLTQTGMTLGTAYYMAPEQRIAAKEVDWRADQYALGVVMYELLTGNIPMGAVKPLDQARRDLPKRYAAAVMRAMAPKPEDRWQSFDAWWAEIAAPPSQSSKAALILVLLGVTAAIAAAAGYLIVKNRAAAPTVASAANPASDGVAPSGAAQSPGTGGTTPAPAPEITAPLQGATAPQTPGTVETAADASVLAGSAATTAPPGGSSESPESPPAAPAPTAAGATGLVEASPAAATAGTERLVPQPARADAATSNATQAAASRRQSCIKQCERDDGQCRSLSRRGRQECMRAVGFGGSAASRRADCESNARQADQSCMAQLRDCRSYCE